MGDWFLFPLRVRYQETDKMAVVYHTNYITWFEIGRTEWIRQAGFSYRDIEERGLLLPVINVEASYAQPARYDDWVTVCTRVAQLSKVRIQFEYRVVRKEGPKADPALPSFAAELPEGTLLAGGSTTHGWINEKWKVVALDRAAPDIYDVLRSRAGLKAD